MKKLLLLTMIIAICSASCSDPPDTPVEATENPATATEPKATTVDTVVKAEATPSATADSCKH